MPGIIVIKGGKSISKIGVNVCLFQRTLTTETQQEEQRDIYVCLSEIRGYFGHNNNIFSQLPLIP
jgi:hypothetical protein